MAFCVNIFAPWCCVSEGCTRRGTAEHSEQVHSGNTDSQAQSGNNMDQDAIDQFVAVTGSNPDTAQFFLESSQHDVAAAIDQFFSAGGQVQAEESVPAEPSRGAAGDASAITPASSGPRASAPAVGKPMAGQAKGMCVINNPATC